MRTGILVPGAGYRTPGPLLDLADVALPARGWAVPAGLLQVGPEPSGRAPVTAA